MRGLVNTLSYEFEELPNFWEGDMRSGSHNGVAEISYTSSGEWFVSAISLDCHNGECGDKCKSKMIPLVHHHILREDLIGALTHFSGGFIQDKVNDALAEDVDTRPRRSALIAAE